MRRVLKWLGILLSSIVSLLVLIAVDRSSGSPAARIVDRHIRNHLNRLSFRTPARQTSPRANARPSCVAATTVVTAKGWAVSVFNDDVVFGYIVAPDLTRSVADARPMRNSIAVDSPRRAGSMVASTIVMPSASFHSLTDEDLNNLAVFIRSEAASDGPETAVKMGIGARLFLLLDKFDTQAEEIEKYAPWISPQELTGPLGEGRYLALTICAECHGMDFTGFMDFTPGLAAVKAYGKEDFHRLMREGIALGDRELGLMRDMSLRRFSVMTDAEIDSLYAYLGTLADTTNQ